VYPCIIKVLHLDIISNTDDMTYGLQCLNSKIKVHINGITVIISYIFNFSV